VGLGSACSYFLNSLGIVRTRGRVEVVDGRDVGSDNRVSTVTTCNLNVATNLLEGLYIVVNVACIRVAF